MARGRSHVYQRPDRPGYYARCFITGRPVYKGSFSTKARAQSWIDRRTLEAERDEVLGIQPLLRQVTLSEYLPRWRESLHMRLRESTA